MTTNKISFNNSMVFLSFCILLVIMILIILENTNNIIPKFLVTLFLIFMIIYLKNIIHYLSIERELIVIKKTFTKVVIKDIEKVEISKVSIFGTGFIKVVRTNKKNVSGIFINIAREHEEIIELCKEFNIKYNLG